MTSVKEVARETLEGRPDLPSEEDGPKRSPSDNASTTVSTAKDGEKRVARALRVVGGSTVVTPLLLFASGHRYLVLIP
jgi:hypothetical protein